MIYKEMTSPPTATHISSSLFPQTNNGGQLQHSMKKTFTLFRSLSTCIMPSPAVAPWPPVRSAYDHWLAAELDDLRADPCTGAAWLSCALDLAVAAQRRLVASSSLNTASGAGSVDPKTIDECVDDTAEMLDACVGLRDRLDMLRNYVNATRIALHWHQEGNGYVAARRAAAAFTECEGVERRCGAELAKCGSNLRKLGERALLKHPAGSGAGVDDEALSGARGAALLAVGAMGAALAFRARRSVSSVSVSGNSGGKALAAQWECTLQDVQKRVREEYDRRRKDGVPCMAELEAAAAAVRAVKSSVAAGRQCSDTVIAVARKGCDELEQTILTLEHKIGELHRGLVNVRMVLLDCAQKRRGPEVLRL